VGLEGNALVNFAIQRADRLYRQIFEALAKDIRCGNYRPGELLPSERDLSKQLGVSRTSVREALVALEVGGFVEIRTGYGVCVAARPPTDEAEPPDDGGGVDHLMTARTVIEAEVAAMAAATGTDEQIAELGRLVTTMAGEIDDQRAFYEDDRRFHALISAMTGNPIFSEITEVLWKKRQSEHYAAFERQYSGRATIEKMCADHSDILAALERRDAAAARDTMRRHIEHARAILFDEPEETGAVGA
jgi:GntR family transcriptional regulator, uxu operon transcriptional repressor